MLRRSFRSNLFHSFPGSYLARDGQARAGEWQRTFLPWILPCERRAGESWRATASWVIGESLDLPDSRSAGLRLVSDIRAEPWVLSISATMVRVTNNSLVHSDTGGFWKPLFVSSCFERKKGVSRRREWARKRGESEERVIYFVSMCVLSVYVFLFLFASNRKIFTFKMYVVQSIGLHKNLILVLLFLFVSLLIFYFYSFDIYNL